MGYCLIFFILAVSLHAVVSPLELFGVVILPSAFCLLPQHNCSDMKLLSDSLLHLMLVKVHVFS